MDTTNSTIAPKLRLRAFHNTQSDADRHERTVVLLNGLMFAQLGVVAAGWLPGWTCFLTIPSLFVRWLNTVHEVSHLRDPDRVNLVVRLHLLLTGPLTAGFRELRTEHLAHHQHACTKEDPTMYIIEGNHLRGLLAAFASPEHLLFDWVKTHGVDRRLAGEVLLRGAAFGLAAWAFGAAFAWYWVALRVSYAAAFFAFFRAIHRRGPAMGLYRTALPKIGEVGLWLLFGAEARNAILHHDIHHGYELVGARVLDQARVALDTPSAEPIGVGGVQGAVA